jgi:hypothetical protein
MFMFFYVLEELVKVYSYTDYHVGTSAMPTVNAKRGT